VYRSNGRQLESNLPGPKTVHLLNLSRVIAARLGECLSPMLRSGSCDERWGVLRHGFCLPNLHLKPLALVLAVEVSGTSPLVHAIPVVSRSLRDTTEP